jgi:glucosamine--fructose-6-phosphate aminotransferase (isomerizing)
MCGVVSIVYPKHNPALGLEAGNLVRQLEYRGYDSTGVATIGEDGAIALRKRVGAPSRVVVELGIESMAGQKAIGQVRWATYGSVTDTNAQPHEVRCKVHMVGAHNGNISNTDALKDLLVSRGHQVASDNDGEMLVHVVEDFFAEEGGPQAPETARRHALALRAIRRAHQVVQGSYAACIAFPGLPGVYAMKAGSSLYAGKGSDAAGEFVVVSSDLTSVLSKTRLLVPLAEGEGLHFTDHHLEAFSLDEDRAWVPALRRSRLNVADIALHPPYRYFMEQEIAQAGPNLEALERYYLETAASAELDARLRPYADDVDGLLAELLRVSQLLPADGLREAQQALTADRRLKAIQGVLGDTSSAPLVSDEAPILAEIAEALPEARPAAGVLDRLSVWKKQRRILADKARFLSMLKERGELYVVGSGTSYHACLTAAAFFAPGQVAMHVANPGTFRSTYLPALREGDVVLGVTQSGETKDLVDVFNDVRQKHGKAVHLVSFVNNENSTIPQEKSDFFLPILCGPEIAVAATKSFVSQLALFWLLARGLRAPDARVATELEAIRGLMARTLRETRPSVDDLAQLLCLRPSLHILGTALPGIAREGALKIREVVLNHTEGYDAAEFKHGPNTILGKNTVFGWEDLRRAHEDGAAGRGFDPERFFSNYPLLFVCPPDEREVRITISQIHTHKIRGADILLVAEENPDLRRAVQGRPDRAGEYVARYVTVPPTGDRDAFVFQAAIVLQELALRMSVAKMKVLDEAGVREHGVHPDVPKNVSKSITVD